MECQSEQSDDSVLREHTRMRMEIDRLNLQIEEIKKTFAIHSCPPEGRFCWLCAALEKIEKTLEKKPPANIPLEGPRNPPEPAPRIERQNPEAGEF